MKKRYFIVSIIIVLIIIIALFILKIKLKKIDLEPEENKSQIEILEKNKIRVYGRIWYKKNNENNEEYVDSKEIPVKDYDIELNKKIEYVSDTTKLKFEITEILENGIKIKTEEEYYQKNGDGSYDTTQNNKEFIIENNSQIRISKSTLDSGTTYIIEVAK